MTDLLPGQDVTVSGSSGGVARLIYVRGNSARVRFAVTGKERTVELSRVTPKRESKALSVGPLDPSIPTTFRAIGGADA